MYGSGFHDSPTETGIRIVEKRHTIVLYPITLLSKIFAISAMVFWSASVILFFAALLVYSSMPGDYTVLFTQSAPGIFWENVLGAIACWFISTSLVLAAIMSIVFDL